MLAERDPDLKRIEAIAADFADQLLIGDQLAIGDDLDKPDARRHEDAAPIEAALIEAGLRLLAILRRIERARRRKRSGIPGEGIRRRRWNAKGRAQGLGA